MAVVDGGALFAKALRNEGVERAFVLCGGHVMPIFYGMRDAGIEIVDGLAAGEMIAVTAVSRLQEGMSIRIMDQ